jgi:prepilin-type N-terminal cleavage/methylation domain-containing protein
MRRLGFTLVELLIATVVAAILGTALARLLVSDSRFVALQESMLGARRTARTAMNWMNVELRMISDGGLLDAAPESVAVRVPYAFGMVCDRVSGDLYVSLLPVDSLAYANATADGLAWRRSTGIYSFVSGVGVTMSTDTIICAGDSIKTVPGGKILALSGTPSGAPNQPVIGSVAYLYQDVSYKFAASTDLPGRIGLWRKAGSAAYEELVAPFDTAAGFGFLVGGSTTALTSPPADLTTVTGLELRLVGASDFIPRKATRAQTFDLVPQLRFGNRNP